MKLQLLTNSTSGPLQYDWNDVLNHLVVVVGTAIVTGAATAINSGGTPNWQTIGWAALGAALTYLGKTLASGPPKNSNGNGKNGGEVNFTKKG
jgi:hypothetical protein